MSKPESTRAADFRLLCKVVGGRDPAALHACLAANTFPQLFAAAQSHDVLPALAVRCEQQHLGSVELGEEKAALLKAALMENTQRNMSICAQAIKIGKQLNQAGITPLFLKGTARLLSAPATSMGFRKQSDIDLIVPPANIEKAGDVFLSDGYRYCHVTKDATLVPMTADTRAALRFSAAHHHLPPLLKTGYAATVELHRHHLDRRFQRANPVTELFAHARQLESHGTRFQVPCREQHIIHLVLGKLVNDGHLARRAFPLREACDLIDLLDESAEAELKQDWIIERCGRKFSLFLALVSELMDYQPRTRIAADTANYAWLMQKRYESPLAAKLLDAYARAEYLANALIYSPAKLPGYLQGLVPFNR